MLHALGTGEEDVIGYAKEEPMFHDSRNDIEQIESILPSIRGDCGKLTSGAGGDSGKREQRRGPVGPRRRG